MIRFEIKGQLLLLVYYTENEPWVVKEFEKSGQISLKKKTFTFLEQDLLSDELDSNDENNVFIFGRLVGEYFRIEPRILGIRQAVFIHKDIKTSIKFFVAIQTVPIFRKLGDVIKGDIYIGGNVPNALPESELNRLIKAFPNSYEIQRYVLGRLGVVLSNYFESTADLEQKYERYMNKRQSEKGENLLMAFKENELVKFEALLEKLERMLQEEDLYNEKQWQNEILDIILLLYPKYIRVFKEVIVRDTYKEKNKKLDFLLVDANGNVDIIEIKRPREKKIITNTTYRDNHIPLRELSGTVMQIEKYIYHLNKWGKVGEEKLTEKYKDRLPAGLEIKVINPCGMIIMGRDLTLSLSQKGDFEVVKRKYKNIIDIITYDDLLRRLKFIIEALKKP